MFMEILPKSRIQCECEKKALLLYVLYSVYLPALINAHVMMLHLK